MSTFEKENNKKTFFVSTLLDWYKGGKLGDNVVFKTWNTAEELEEELIKTIAEETEMTDVDDIEGFNLSLGGKIENGWMNFGDKPEMIDDWQVLSAYRNDSVSGTATINRYIHERYRFDKMQTLKNGKIRGTKHILGTDGIVYGDKVINTRNQRRAGYPKEPQNNYVANGEVGIVERLWEKPKSKWNQHQVRFSSQPGCSYTWYSYVPTEGNSDLELAYALTVHKAQGSEFEKAILILGEPGRLLSKEMLYTAITRQKEKLIILYNDEAYHLRDYSMPYYSEVAKRFTCLFKMPDIVEHENIYFERNLIHKTLRGELVRSKSEVIIANMLYEAGIEYEYEKELNLGEDGKRIPDFTFEDAESGTCIYWEHCGMMGDKNYRERWEEKKAIYEEHGIIEDNNLIVTEDALNGGIDSEQIRGKIEWLKSKL